MDTIIIDAVDLMIAATLVLVLAGITLQISKELSRLLLVGAVRTTVQLLLVGLVLKILFSNARFEWVVILACEICVAGKLA